MYYTMQRKREREGGGEWKKESEEEGRDKLP